MTTTALVDTLWQARGADVRIPAPALSPDEGYEVLRDLTARAVADGDDVVGWKIARLPSEPTYTFAAPVFASSLAPGAGRRLPGLRAEVEYVAQLGPTGGASDITWRLGFELIANHDPDWHVDTGWAIADWGFHAAAAVGAPRITPDPPQPGPGGPMTVTVAEQTYDKDINWLLSAEQVLTVLAADCARIVRPAQSGDLVWTGALCPPFDLRPGDRFAATVPGFEPLTISGI